MRLRFVLRFWRYIN